MRRRTLLGPVALGALLILSLAGPAGAHPARPAGAAVLAITQSGNVTNTSTFTISEELANASAVSFTYFTFCQLTSPVCYAPVQMVRQGSTDWFAGTTKPMTAYPGMNPGTTAGYNITVEYSNGTNVTEPTLPNHFANLTVTTSVSGEYMFEMHVRDAVYTLGGTITDSVTGHALAGARVALSPGTNATTTAASGAYSFTGLFNGSYTLTVSATGYHETNQTVVIAGVNLVKDVTVVNATTSTGTGPTHNGSGGGGGSSLLPGYAAYVIGVIAAVAVLGGLFLMRRRRGEP